jgi:hypothetical protein
MESKKTGKFKASSMASSEKFLQPTKIEHLISVEEVESGYNTPLDMYFSNG